MKTLSRRSMLMLTTAACLTGPSIAMAESKLDKRKRRVCIKMGGKPTRRFFRFHCEGVKRRRWHDQFPPTHLRGRRERPDPGDGGGRGGQFSDRRLKQDIVAIGKLPNGLDLYRFKYRWSEIEYVGVMAQEALSVSPEAVQIGPDGFYRVDYDVLGFAMTPYAQWHTNGRPHGAAQRAAA
jgi:hypothetical protein